MTMTISEPATMAGGILQQEGRQQPAGPLLSVRDVVLKFGLGANAYQALDHISVDVPRGEFLCLLGPSGCGKSTLLNIIAGFLPITSGSVQFSGQEVTRPGSRRMMVFQDSSLALLPWLTATENVAFGMELRGIQKEERFATVPSYLSAVGLAMYGSRFPHEMSGGMRQRLQIARALATRPDVLLMDEPFGALDALTRRHMHDILLDIWRQWDLTIIFVTHDISESVLLADRVAVMSIGPRSSIRKLLDLRHLGRPREPTSPEFGSVYREIERLLDSDPNMSDSI